MPNETSDKCIMWPRGRFKDGYGAVYVRTPDGGWTMAKAHRLAYCEAHGLALEDIKGRVVRHKCDNRACVNPDHLELGTHRDNMRDMVDRGRSCRGDMHYASLLTPDEVKAIRSEHVPRCKVRGSTALGRKYGVSRQTIDGIVAGRRWRHV